MVIKDLLKLGLDLLENNEYTRPINESRKILSFLMDVDESYLHAYPEKEVDENIEKEYIRILKLRNKALPLQYILKSAYFYGREYYVDNNVLIPRPDTEVLVEKTIDLAKKTGARNILEIGVGSGAITCSLAIELPNVEFVGVDISKDALKIANRNKGNYGLKNLEFLESDLFSNIEGKYDIIISNPPYIPKIEMETLQAEVTMEPKLALYGGIDGLDFYREISKMARSYLNDQGIIIYEIGYNQYEKVKEILSSLDYKDISYEYDLNGFKRVIYAEMEGWNVRESKCIWR